MNFLDLIIIYLACGSPFGVHFFLYNHPKRPWLIPKSLIIIIFWIPFAVRLLHIRVTKLLLNNKIPLNINSEQKEKNTLKQSQKLIEKQILQTSAAISLFEIREILERYIGLTKLINVSEKPRGNFNYELFQVTKNKNPQISAICLNRLNQTKLFFHQKKARQDFIKLAELSLKRDFGSNKLGNLLLNFVKILRDPEAEKLIKLLIDKIPQTSPQSPVKELEKIYGKRKQHYQNY